MTGQETAGRVDHAAEARAILRRVSTSQLSSAEASVLVAGAQVQATLALVEQQRIANLAAALNLGPTQLTEETIKADASEVTRRRIALRNTLRAQVREALGL